VLDELVTVLTRCKRCVVLTGAGMSAESGVPTFRGDEGLWRKFRPEELANVDAFMANPEIVWEWYNWRRQLMAEVEPNPGHFAITAMEECFEHFAMITQNVDGLHRAAGTQSILELHGNITRNKCLDCHRPFELEGEVDPAQIPVCVKCGGKIRPDVVWFGEMLDPETIQNAFFEAEKADVFFSIGTSAVVHPAASLPVTAKRHGAVLVEINPERTPLSELADFHFSACSGEFLPSLIDALRETDGKGE